MQALLVLFFICGSTIVDIQSVDTDRKRIVFPVCVFFAVVTLHWLIWQFIVPECRIIGSNAKSFIIFPSPCKFVSDQFFFLLGYTSIALHCLTLGGHLPLTGEHSFRSLDEGNLEFGLILIGIGIASRLRGAFYEMHFPEKTSQS